MIRTLAATRSSLEMRVVRILDELERGLRRLLEQVLRRERRRLQRRGGRAEEREGVSPNRSAALRPRRWLRAKHRNVILVGAIDGRLVSPDRELIAARPEIKTRANEATPLMVGGGLYVSTSASQVAAIDARSGRTLWRSARS